MFEEAILRVAHGAADTRGAIVTLCAGSGADGTLPLQKGSISPTWVFEA